MSEPIAVLGVAGGRVPAGCEARLAHASLVVGGRALLKAHAPAGARRVELGADLEPALAALAAAPGAACVLASGDPGFFGIVRRLTNSLGPERLDVHPAASSVATAFARLGLPWDDALVVSAHARAPETALHAIARHPKVAVLTGPGSSSAAALAGALRGLPRELAVAERLGEPDERVIRGTPEALAEQVFAEPNVLVALDPSAARGRGANPASRVTAWPPRTPPGWGLPESAFEHRAAMITKAEVRALALARLGPGLGDLVWDVGCGSGSVGVECARLGAAVVAVDTDRDAIECCERNAATHGVPVRTVVGTAPAVLAELPDPDAAFVGGGGAELDAILDVVGPRIRRAVVVTLAVIERVGPAMERLRAAGLEVDATSLQASRVRPLGDGHRLAAENPVFVLTGVRR